MIKKDFIVTVRSRDGVYMMKAIVYAYTPHEAIDLGKRLAISLGYVTIKTIHEVQVQELYDGMVVCGTNRDVRSFDAIQEVGYGNS